MKEKKGFKYFIYIFIFLIVISLTFYTIFCNNNISDVIRNIGKMNISYILICILLFILYFILQGIYMKHNLKILKKDIKLHKGIFYSLIEFFFSGITPSSTGGQPVQLYYMNKDKIPTKKSLITLLINTIYFKLILVIFSLLILIFKHKFIFSMSPIFIAFYFIGIIVDIIVAVFGYLTLYKQGVVRNILVIVKKIIHKFNKNYNLTIEEVLKNYKREVNYLSKNKLKLLFEFIITILQRLCMFSIAYVIYRSFGLNEYSYLDIVIIQISVQTAIEFIPLPGGTGVSEYLFGVFFVIVFGESLSSTAMLATRAFSFYIPLLLCGLIILVKFIVDKCKKKDVNS